MQAISNMRWLTCFSSKSYSGYEIGIVKSAMQKFLRRRMPSEMKWCVEEIYRFRSLARDEKELKVSKSLISNLVNRIIVMMDEELLFNEWAVYLKCRFLIDKFWSEDNVDCLYQICDLLCEAKLIRYSSDVSCYHMKMAIKSIDDDEDVYQKFEKFKIEMEKGDVVEAFKIAIHLFLNIKEESLKKRVLRRNHPIYLIWEYLLNLEKVNENENLKKCIVYRFNEYPKKRGEQKLFLTSAISLCIYSERINWDVNWMEIQSKVVSEKIDGYLEIPSYAIDMHTKKGREMGKNRRDFANEGSLVVDEDKEYYNEEYRQFYNQCKYEEAGIKRIRPPRKPKAAKEPKVPKEPKAAKEPKVAKEKKEPKVAKEKKEPKVAKEKKEPKVAKEKKEPKVAKEKKSPKYVAKMPEIGELEYIPMEDMKFVKLCLKNPCGKKVMCFVVEYEGVEYVLKEGKKSMNYNEDYEVVDSMKEVFGLNNIGMKRIFSNKAMVKVDHSKMEWCDNWEFVEKENIVYSMMSYIPGVRFNHSKNITSDLELEYMKIGLFRGIFMVSDFNVTNVFELDGKLYSIDEHDILGKRVQMIGQKNMKYYKKNEAALNGIFEDLFKDKNEKLEKVVNKLIAFKYDRFVDRIVSNYENLSDRFYQEFNASK
jgi:hypothetical protein